MIILSQKYSYIEYFKKLDKSGLSNAIINVIKILI